MQICDNCFCVCETQDTVMVMHNLAHIRFMGNAMYGRVLSQ